MDQGTGNTLTFANVADLMLRLDLPAPLHPLITLVDYDNAVLNLSDAGSRIMLDFYKISFKNIFSGSVRYGPGTYDFKDGGLAFVAPHQFVEMPADPLDYQGYALYFHPDLLHSYPLAQGMHRYGFFSYSVSEALFLSEKEKQVVASLFQAIGSELGNNLDQFSQDVLVSQIELLLNHSNRFYNLQFLTRKSGHNDLIGLMNNYLAGRINAKNGISEGTPSAREIALYLKVSQRYLSDMLRSLTGKTTQEHIHLHLIEKAKDLLATSTLTTAEIAYQLGFEHPQSFNKFFRQKTHLSPALFRKSLNSAN